MPLLFLSHAGADSDAARALKQRILAAPAAKTAGLSVWFDKDDLDAGRMWQGQLEQAIQRSTSFAVLIGSRGVVNWVEAEVRLALSRAMSDPQYRFIPILPGEGPGAESLPGFARQFQGVRDIEGNVKEFDRLMAAVLSGDGPGCAGLEAEPFFGLRAIDQSRSHLFFGRERETDELLQRVYEQPLVLVSGDSGSGKSSLVRAGLVPRFRGGALATLKGTRPQEDIWNVVITRPRSRPWTELANAIEDTSRQRGLSLAERSGLADSAISRDLDRIRRALRCDLPAEFTHTLLVVDQFEELVTVSPEPDRSQFIAFLLSLTDPPDDRYRTVLTMRHDYVNLCNSVNALRQRLDADGRRSRFLLGRMTDDGLRRIVTEPLRLAGISANERDRLADHVLKDVGQRPGDLALVQMALTETWRARAKNEGNLASAYIAVGGVEGALAGAAEQVRTRELTKPEHAGLAACLDSVLVRIVSLGDTGGATRRVAGRQEFDDEQWRLVQLLAGEDGKRLVILGGDDTQPTVEIAHEALVTAWPYFQALLQSVADDKRSFDALIPKAKEWSEATPAAKVDRLATGAELEQFTQLLGRRATWLAVSERDFVESSAQAVMRRRRRDVWLQRATAAFAMLMLVAFVAAAWFALGLRGALDRVNGALAAALWNRLDSQDSDENLTALWGIRLGDDELRRAVLRELLDNPSRPEQLGRRAAPIVRAINLRWTAQDADAALVGVVTQIKGSNWLTTDHKRLSQLYEALRALSGQLSPESARLASATALEAMGTTIEDDLVSLVLTTTTLHVTHTDEDRKAMVGSIVKAYEGASQVGEDKLIVAMRTLARSFAADEVQTVFAPILAEVLALHKSVGDNSRVLYGRLLAVQELARRFSPEQAREPLAAMIEIFPKTIDARNVETFRTLASAASAFPVPFTNEQAAAALYPALNAIDAIQHDPSSLYSRSLFLDRTGSGLAHLANRLTAEQAKFVHKRLVAAILFDTSPRALADSGGVALVQALGALPSQLADADVRLVISFIKQLADFHRDTDRNAAIALARRLTQNQAQAFLPELLEEIRNQINNVHNVGVDRQVVNFLAAVLRELPVQLTSSQYASVVDPLLGELQKSVRDPGLGQLRVALTSAFWEGDWRTFLDLISVLGGKLPAVDAQEAFTTFVSLQSYASTVSEKEPKALRALATSLTAEQADKALSIVRSRLGWCNDDELAREWTEVLAILLQNAPAEKRVSDIVEMLKYPGAAGSATDRLLDALHETATDAPGKEAGLNANLTWLSRRYPTIDIDAHPACPPPLGRGVACPNAVR